MKEGPSRQDPLHEEGSGKNEPARAPEHHPDHVGAFGLYERDGLTLLLDDTSLVDQVAIGGGGWEVAQIYFMRAAARHFLGPNNGAFLDIGAYWGLYAMHAVMLGVPEVHLFEPDPRNFAQLQAQLFLNDMVHRTQVHHSAVSDRNGSIAFRESVKGENRGGASVVDDGSASTIEVPCVTLDDLFDWSGRTIAIKLDVEKHETAVMRGMKRLVARNKVFMQVEAFDDTRADTLAVAGELGLRHVFSVQPVDHYVTNLTPGELGWFYSTAARMGFLAR